MIQLLETALFLVSHMKHDSSKTIWKSFLIYWFIGDIQSPTFLHMYDFWNNKHEPSPGPEISKMWSAVLYITGYIENFVQILILINRTKIVWIWTNLIIFPVVNIESTKKADHILEMPRPGVFCDY